jgi:DNA-binding CsgD family transcriptional regulator
MENQILELVGLIYDAAQDPVRWSDFLRRYAEILNAHITQLEFFGDEVSVGASFGMSAPDIEEFKNFASINPWLPLLHRAEPGAVGASHELVPDAEYLRSPYYNDMGRRIDQYYGQAGLMIRSSSTLGVIGAVRNKAAGPCGAWEIGLLQALMPHLARALRMHQQFAKLDAQASALMDSLDQLARGIVLLDGCGRLLRANQAAERMAGQADGLYLSSSGLRAADTAESTALQRLILVAAQTAKGSGLSSGGTMTISRPSLRRPWIAVISPHKGPLGEGLAAVMLIDPEEHLVPCAAIVSKFVGFTAAETRLAQLLASGVRLETAAEQLGITMNTARTHTRRMLDKTGLRRQTDLVLLLNKLPRKRKPEIP